MAGRPGLGRDRHNSNVVFTACLSFLDVLARGGDSKTLEALGPVIRDFAVSVLSPVAGISGAILGFYFGERKGERTAQQQQESEPTPGPQSPTQPLPSDDDSDSSSALPTRVDETFGGRVERS